MDRNAYEGIHAVLTRIADALEQQNELMAQANKIGERNVAAAERMELGCVFCANT
jgi:hypothetical protein